MSFGKPPSPMENHGRRYQLEEIEKAIELKNKSGMTWMHVARIMGRSPDSLATVTKDYRKGLIKFAKVENDALAETMAEEIINGASLSQTARKYGRYPSSLHRTLARIGWDMEMLIEARKERQACSSTTTSSVASSMKASTSPTGRAQEPHRSSDTR